jgi:hypothetical protein
MRDNEHGFVSEFVVNNIEHNALCSKVQIARAFAQNVEIVRKSPFADGVCLGWHVRHSLSV